MTILAASSDTQTAWSFRVDKPLAITILAEPPRLLRMRQNPPPRARHGEGHHWAVLTDHEVELMLELRDEGITLSRLAAMFEVSKGCAWKIVSGRRRCR